MKACEHFRYKNYDTEIQMSEGFSWNGWIYAYEGYKLVWSEFRTGIRWDYLNHLLSSSQCRKTIGLTKREVARMIRIMEKEWEAVT